MFTAEGIPPYPPAKIFLKGAPIWGMRVKPKIGLQGGGQHRCAKALERLS